MITRMFKCKTTSKLGAVVILLIILTTIQQFLNTTEQKERVVIIKKKPASELPQPSSREEIWNKIETTLKNEPVSKKLPGVIGIGVEKCGTHALMEFLRPHPMIVVPWDIEMHYFDSDLYDPKNISKYIEMMPYTAKSVITFEKTPSYFSFPPFDLPKRIITDAPETKLLLVLCEPTARVLSDFYQEWALHNISRDSVPGIGFFKTIDSYLHNYLRRYNQLSICHKDQKTKFSNAASVINSHYNDYISTILTTGLYDLHMARWLNSYNQSNLMVIDAGELSTNPGQLVERVQKFLNIPKLLLPEDYVQNPKTGFFCYKDWRTGEAKCMEDKTKHRTRGVVKLKPEMEKTLKKFYQCHNEELYNQLGYRMNWD